MHPGDDVDDARRYPADVEPVRDRRDHERSEERAPHLAAAAEEAHAADHGGGDRVEQQRAAAEREGDRVGGWRRG